MRTTTLTNVTIYYPDELAFAFKPLLVKGSTDSLLNPNKTIATMDVMATYSGIVHTATYYARQGMVYADISAFVRSFFDPATFGVDYSQNVSVSNTYIDGIAIEVTINYEDGTSETTPTLTFGCVWGAEDYGGDDSFYALRDVRWWTNFPFTLGCYIGANGAAVMNGQSYALNKGISNVQPPSGVGDLINAYTIEGGIIQSTFDNTFDITFQGSGGTVLQVARLHVDNKADKGIYLRWVDRHGFFSYWLFCDKTSQRTTEALKTFERADFGLYSDAFGFSNGAGLRQNIRRGDVLPICSPLVNSFTFDYLQDITTSPLVDMYCGDDNGTPQWMSVGVQTGTWTKTDDELQDFVLNIVRPYTPTQSL